MISINAWSHVEYFTCNHRAGKVSRSIPFPDQWRWRGDIVFAQSLEEAKVKFEQQYRAEADYWERLGNRNFMWVVGGYRGAIYRHRANETLWKFKDFAFHADSESDAYELLLERYAKRETA